MTVDVLAGVRSSKMGIKLAEFEASRQRCGASGVVNAMSPLMCVHEVESLVIDLCLT